MSSCNQLCQNDTGFFMTSPEEKPGHVDIENAESPYWRELPEDPNLERFLPLARDFTPAFDTKEWVKPLSSKLYIPDHRAFLPTAAFLVLSLLLSAMQWSDYSWSLYVSKAKILDGEYWRYVSAIFAHADMAHYFSNAGLIAFFGWILTGYFGKYGFPIFSFLIGIAANIATVMHYPETTRLVGASGMLYGMVGFWLTLFLIKEDSFRFTDKLMRAFAVFLMLLVPTQFDPNTSYLAHGYGFLFGVIAGALFYFVPTGPLSKRENQLNQ